ncbi:hypothetical protein C8R41DRAFT_847853 [Lentinula lateritia]|uniref:Transposase n=1 Tax=Lentinula lateritia TaxID=40482 RepID=A0ABQ8V901_9AGAR|nr:hypothetical protein C8R41DRAFT_847853 [Lentinula lateritia]
MKDIYRTNADTYLDELMWYLVIHHDTVISKSSLHENLRKAGLTRKLLHKIALERDEALRAEYSNMIRTQFSGSGFEFVTVDESSKNDHTLSRRYGYSLCGQPAESEEPFIRGKRYSLAAAF